jgi:hypothetical protein
MSMKVLNECVYILVLVTVVTSWSLSDSRGHEVILVLRGDHVVMVTDSFFECGGDQRSLVRKCGAHVT